MTVLPEVEKHYGRLKFFINGSWIDSSSDQIYEDVNPATGEVIAEFPSATDSEIEQAIQAAQAALEDWRAVPLRDKARYLFDLRGKFEEHFDRLCRVLVQDHGRTIGEARGTLRRCIENIESACSALLLLTNKRKAAFLELEFLLAEHPKSYKVIFRYFPFLSEDNGITSLLERFDLPI